MNKTPAAKKALAEALILARIKRDRFTISILEQGLVDFDPQPEYKPGFCKVCGHSNDPMGGCYCVWGDGDETRYP